MVGRARGPGAQDNAVPSDEQRAAVDPPGPGPAAPPAQNAAAQLLDPVMYRPVRVSEKRTRGAPGVALQLLLAVVLGVVTVTAIGSLRVPQPSDVSARGLLVTQIQERAASADELMRGNRGIDEEISTLQNDLLRVTDRGLVSRLEQSALLAGTAAVAGPGLVIELDDPDLPEDALSHESRVQDVDIQIVVNHLRAAGAEAVAVNGHRLTALSAIRSAGEAIWVDLTPLIPPYRVEAIGDVKVMQAQFARSPGSAHLQLLTSTYGISATTQTAAELRLPSASTVTLRYATAPEGAEPLDDVTSSMTDDGGTS